MTPRQSVRGPKPWHLLTHDEKIAQCQRFCKWCGKAYVDSGALWLHENQKCPKRDIAAEVTLRSPRGRMG